MVWSRLPLKPNLISKTQEISIYWIIFGLIELILGISGYYRYLQGGLFFFIIPEQIELKNIIFGTISILIGIRIIFFEYINQNSFFHFQYGFLGLLLQGLFNIILTGKTLVLYMF
jgi:hypothetical protein